MTCKHTDRPNVLSLPSMGNPHCCRECWDALPRTQYKGKREAWELEGDYRLSNGVYYVRGTGGYDVALSQPEGMRYKGGR